MDDPTPSTLHAADPVPETLERGRPWPMGAHWDGHGVNFAVFSAHAQAMELCLFDSSGERDLARLRLPSRTGDIWHGRLPGAVPGLVYGLRAHGPWQPDEGHRFNPHKLLLDPYAREIVGRYEWRDEHFAASPQVPQQMDARDNAAHALKARVVSDQADAAPAGHGGRRHRVVSPADTVLYELHVKGFSRSNPAVPAALRGTYAGLGHEASIAHLRRLGVSAVSLLPVHQCIDEQRLGRLGLTNYWGYNTIGFFSPDPRLASGAGGLSVRDEFRAMVARLHQAGIEVILDVVFNHTAEADESGPTISFRGLDNASYYRLPPARSRYENHTGCGNTLDIRRPAVLRLVMDSLRYWAGAMQVDGFRFDLATVLGRGDDGFDRTGPFFSAVAQDPLLSRVKLIAEPWDIGPGGYQVGQFPRGWMEWNDQFRDAMRSFWLGARTTRGEAALRLCGSSDIYQAQGRAPAESVNYVVSHDGFTLRDLVSYREKHNQANGEHNRDGHGHNLSVNCGVEGASDDEAVNALRGRLQRALLATTLLAQGTPMLCGGDELGHTQRGNNNPYCQDNDTTWICWEQADDDLIAFTSHVLALRRQALPFGEQWYSGLTDPLGLHDLTWLGSDGKVLHDEAWRDATARVFGCLIGQPGRAAAPLLLLLNGGDVATSFLLPAGVWQALLDTAHPRGVASWHGQGEVPIELAAHSLMLLGASGHDIVL